MYRVIYILDDCAFQSV